MILEFVCIMSILSICVDVFLRGILEYNDVIVNFKEVKVLCKLLWINERVFLSLLVDFILIFVVEVLNIDRFVDEVFVNYYVSNEGEICI